MASIYDLKPRFQAFLRPAVGRLADGRVTANQVTVAAAVLSVAYGVILWLAGPGWILLFLPVVLMIRMALNAVDGMLAREHNQISRLGAFLNELGDVVSDTALYLPLVLLIAPEWPLLGASAILAFALTEFAGVTAQAVSGDRRYDGPFGKSDRALFFSVVAVIYALFALPAWIGPAVVALALALAILTTVNRVRAALGDDGDE